MIKSTVLDNDEFFVKTSPATDENDDETDDGDYDNSDELLNFIGSMKLDTLVWPTITGSLDFEEFDDNYYAHARLNIPGGEIEIRNRLEYPVS